MRLICKLTESDGRDSNVYSGGSNGRECSDGSGYNVVDVLSEISV
jgi:hypothetical protein